MTSIMLHRIGSTGRAGRCGKAFSLVKGKEVYKLKDIQRYCKNKKSYCTANCRHLMSIAKIRAEKNYGPDFHPL